jgi:hypothetical protein
MIRYLAVSTVIVLAVAVVVAGWTNRDLIRIKLASVYARASAKPGAFAGFERATEAPLSGDAPWALSALPECLTQTTESEGSFAYVRAHLPAGAVPILPPARLVYGDCSIRIVGDEAYVRRGVDRLRIPPRVQFYRADGLLVLIRRATQGDELRVYEPAKR